MKITFLNHSSIRIDLASGLGIICDPWFTSKAFNSSWELCIEVQPNLSTQNSNDLIFISHEHPDHLNFPTLRKWFRGNQILLRNDFRPKISKSLEGLGHTLHLVTSNTLVQLNSNGDTIAIIGAGIDSALYVREGESGFSILNMNDAELSEDSLRSIRSSVGKIDMVAGQFGLAGYSGFSTQEIRKNWEDKVARLTFAAKILNARLVLPFASFARFCRNSNSYLNTLQPSLAEVSVRLAHANARLWVPLPNEQIDSDLFESQSPLDARVRIEFWDSLVRDQPRSYVSDDETSFEELMSVLTSFYNRVARLPKSRFIEHPRIVVAARCMDQVFKFEIGGNAVNLSVGSTAEADFEAPSNDLVLAFKQSYGADTLHVSGSARVFSQERYSLFHGIYRKLHAELDLFE